MNCIYLLSLLVLSACGSLLQPDSPCGDCISQYPAATCGSAKIACICVPPEYLPPNPATCPELVFSHLEQAFNTYESRTDEFNTDDWLYASLLSSDFRFIDETIGVEITGKENEIRTTDRVFSSYRSVQYALRDSSREYTDDGCLAVCGVVEMLLLNRDENTEVTSGFSIADETCLTVCPDPNSKDPESGDDLWYLTEWRILRSLPSKRKGLEVATWGEVRRISHEELGQ